MDEHDLAPCVYGMKYHVDIVVCIDCTSSMAPVLDRIKDDTLHACDGLREHCHRRNTALGSTRLRVIAFRDHTSALKGLKGLKVAHPPIQASRFFTLPEETELLAAFLRELEAFGGGDDEEEDGLEALALAMRSDWDVKGHHIIVLWTDAAPHELGARRENPAYPAEMPESLDELGEWWGEGATEKSKMPHRDKRQLHLFAPDTGGWKYISDNWQQVCHCPCSLYGGVHSDGLLEGIFTILFDP